MGLPDRSYGLGTINKKRKDNVINFTKNEQ